MHHIIKQPETEIDLNKVRYDLALIYAKEKFAHALNLSQNSDQASNIYHPAKLDEADYLMEQFEFAINYYSNTDDKMLLKNLDFTYESDS